MGQSSPQDVAGLGDEGTIGIGQASDYTQAEALITDIPAEHVLGDKGYDSGAFRDAIRDQDAVPVIPPRSTSPQVPCDFALYCERNLVERFFLIRRQPALAAIAHHAGLDPQVLDGEILVALEP
jgi:transposase